MSEKKVKFDYDPKKKNRMFPIIQPLSKPLVKAMFRYKVVGKENLPEGGGYIIACNHVTALDPVYLVSSVFPKPVHFMAKIELFKNPVARWFLTGMNAFPINRAGFDATSIHFAEALVAQGDVLGIFPEGTRSKTLEPQRGKGGVALIAQATCADVVPLSIYFSEKPHFRSRLTVRIGKPIPYEELKLTNPDRHTQEMREAANYVMEKIKELWVLGHA